MRENTTRHSVHKMFINSTKTYEIYKAMHKLPYGYLRMNNASHPDQQDGPATVMRETTPRICKKRLKNGLFEISVGELIVMGPGNTAEEPDRVEHIIHLLAAEERAQRMGKRFL